jgi:radical SAM protein with 4Fe4S-binding SPASM domain
VKFVSVEDFKKCLKNINVKRVEQFRLFNFGEPLLHPQVAKFAQIARQQKWKCKHVEISTNGQLCAREQLTRLFSDRAMTDLVVSCDGDGTSEMYERLRPPAKWKTLMVFLQLAKELRDKYNPKVRLITRTIIPKASDKKRWEKILVPMGWKPECRDFILMPERAETPFKKHFKMAKGLCRYMRKERLYVDYNGDVVPCCVHPKAFVMGNLLREKYTQIVMGARRKRYARQMKTSRKSMKICKQCEIS